MTQLVSSLCSVVSSLLNEKLIYLAGFIDPFFSSGVHLALTGALSAAGTIASSIRDTVSEEECAKWHNTKVSVAYTRFLLVVLGSYKQMKAQRMDVLSNVSKITLIVHSISYALVSGHSVTIYTSLRTDYLNDSYPRDG